MNSTELAYAKQVQFLSDVVHISLFILIIRICCDSLLNELDLKVTCLN